MATITVTTLTDENDGGAGGTGISLREAVALAGSGDTIAFDSGVFSAESSTITLTLGEISITAGTLTIDGDADGDGDGDVVISGGDASRILNVSGASTDVTLSHAELTHGAVSGGNSGGALLVASGATVSVNDSQITHSASVANGGAVEVDHATLNLNNTTVSNNSTSSYGGAINGDVATINIADSTLSSNQATYNGGAISQGGSTVTIQGSTFSGNSGAGAGAINANGGSITAENSSFTSNTATSTYGGAFYIFSSGTLDLTTVTLSGNQSAADGGAFFHQGGNASLTNVTISGNQATSNGGAIRIQSGGSVDIYDSTIANNTAGNVGGGIQHNAGGGINLYNTVVAGNQVGGSAGDVFGTLTSATNSFFGETATVTTNTNSPTASTTGDDAKLGALADNGGSVQTMKPQSDSPLIDAGSNAALPTDGADVDGDSNTSETLPLDAAGNARVQGGTVDIGAFELTPNTAPTVSGAPTDVTVTEDVASNIDLSAVSFADGEGDPLTVTLSIDAGTFAAPADGAGVGAGVTETLVNATTITLAGSAADITTYLDTAGNIQYTGASNANGNDAATLTITPNDGTVDGTAATVNIDITAVNDAPSVTSMATASFAEAGTGTAYTVTGSDPDTGDTLSYAISGGADAALFDIDSMSGVITFKDAPDFEAPSDSGADNVYNIEVTASDGTLTSPAQAVAITVTDVTGDIAPVLGNLDGDSISIAPGASASLDTGGNATVTDGDSSDFNAGTLTIIRSGTVAGNLRVDGTTVTAGVDMGSADNALAAGETIYIGGSDIGTVQAEDGQGSNDLSIALGPNATPATVGTLLQNLILAGDSDGSGSLAVTLTDSDGNTSTAATVSVSITTPSSGGGGSSGGDDEQIVVTPIDDGNDGNADETITNTGSTPGSAAIVQNSGNNGNLVTATLPGQTTLTVTGPGQAQSGEDAVTTLINAVDARDGAGETQLIGAAQSFLSHLGTTTTLDVRTIVPTTTGTSLAAPIVISGTAAGAGGTQSEAFVIDMRSLPTGSHLQLDNIEFASIIGSATVTGGAGENFVTGDDANQFIRLGADDDTLYGGGGDDTVGSLGGDDILLGNEGNDLVTGGADNDVVYGNQNDDAVYGNMANDTLYGGQDDDQLYGGQDDDLLFGNRAADMVYGNLGADMLYGNQGNDQLFGGDGDDTLFGGQGDDTLAGGAGANRLTGGVGADSFRLTDSAGQDVILDYHADEGDVITGGLFTAASTIQTVDGGILLSAIDGSEATLTVIGVASIGDLVFA